MLAPKDFYSRLFSSSGYKDKLRTAILYGELSDISKEIAGSDDEIVVFCIESDFVFGKKAETALKTFFSRVSLAVVDDNDLTAEAVSGLIGGASVIVAVGEEPTVNAGRGAAAMKNVKIAAIYTSCRMFFALNGKVIFQKCGKILTAEKYADFLLVSPEFYSSPKKQYLAETLGVAVASLTDIIDYKTAVANGAAVYDKDAVKTLLEAVNFALAPKNFPDEHTALTLAALKVATVKEYSDALGFSAAEKIAGFLDGDAPYGEKKYRAFLLLNKIYNLYLRKFTPDLKTAPDAVKAAKRISDYYRIKEYDILSGFESVSLQPELSKQQKAALLSSLSRDAAAISGATERIEKLYSYLYNGKRRLSAFSKDELRFALLAAAYSSGANLLGMLKADGMANFI